MANAETQQQFLDTYAGQSAEMQQKMYNAGNAEVKGWIDTYKANQGNGGDEDVGGGGGINGNGRPDQKGELMPETYNYYSNDTQAAQDKIVNNLYDYYQKTPNLFTNYQNFKNNFSYDARSDQQKKTLDDWWFGYDKSRQLYTKSIGDLTTLYGSGQLTDADLNNLRTFYPDKYNQVMNKINAQNDMNQYSEMLYGPEDTLDTSNVFNQLGNQFLNNLLSSSYSSNIDYFEQYQNELNSEEMRGWSDRLTDLDTEIDKIDTDLNTLYKDIEKRYEGLGASTAKIQAIYADEAYDLQIQRNSLALEQKSLATKYNSRLQEAQQNFSMRVQQHQLEMQERNQYMSELGFAMDLINFETNEEADERAWKNWTRQIDYQYGNIDSLDPVARRKAVDNSVSQILNQYDGIPMKRSKDQMVEDILELVDGGMSLGDALTQNILDPIKTKPEYIMWYNNKLGTNSPVQYSMNANGQLELTAGTATVQTGDNNYKSIDLQNGLSVSVDTNKVITINGQGFRITQLGGDTPTSGLDLAPATRGNNQEIQAFIGGTLVNGGYGQDGNGNNWVEILGDNGYVYRYNHLKDFNEELANIKANGGRIEAGTVIGRMGESGKASGVHLDLAVYDGRRNGNKSVSPLNALDQAKIFFSSVSAQGLGIGSTSTSVTDSGDIELTYDEEKQLEAIKMELLSSGIVGKNYFNGAKGTGGWESLQTLKKMIHIDHMNSDQIKDYYRKQGISQALQDEPELYNVATTLMTSLYGSNQDKTFNALDKIEEYIEDGNYNQAYNYLLTQLTTSDSKLLSPESKSSITSSKEAIIALQDISDLYEQYIANNGDVGVLKDLFRAAAKSNFVWRWEGDEQLNNILTRMGFAINDYIFKKSGKTVTDAERETYKALFPGMFGRTSVTRTKNAFNSIISTFEDSINGTYRAALQDDFDNLNKWYSHRNGGNTFQWRSLGNYYRKYTDYSDID